MNRFQKYREIMEQQRTNNPFELYPDPQSVKNPTDQPNAVNPSSTARDRMTPDMQQSMLNKFLSSRAVELATDYDARQLALTGAGMTPAVGVGADLAAAIDSLVNLKLGDLAMNVGAMVPGAGQAVGGVKLAAAGLTPAIVKGQKVLPGMGTTAKQADQARAEFRKRAKGLDAGDVKSGDAPGQQKFFTPDETAELARIEGEFASRVARGEVPVSRRGGRDPLEKLMKDIEAAPSPRGPRMDPTPGRTRVRPEPKPEVKPKVEVEPRPGLSPATKTAAATLAATTLLARPRTADSPMTRTRVQPELQTQRREQPVQPTRDTKAPPTTDTTPRRDDTELIYPDQETKKDKTIATRLVSPRGFREDVSFGDIVASLMENRSSRSTAAGSPSGSRDIIDKLPKGTKSVLGGILATVLGLGLAGGFGQRGSGSASAGDVIGGLTDASLLVGLGGLDKLKALGGYDPNIMPRMPGIQAVTSR